MEKDFISIQRDGNIYTIKEVTQEFVYGQKGKITKNNFIIRKNTDRYDRLLSIVKTIPVNGKYTKLVTLINELYNRFNDRCPEWVESPTIPLNFVNERKALVVTKNFMRLVYANNTRSSKTRVHLDDYQSEQFSNYCGKELSKQDCSQELWDYWQEKAKNIFISQINKVSKYRKGV